MELPRGRHFPLHRAGPGSDSGSSGNSSADSIDSSSSSNRPIGAGVGGPNAGSGLVGDNADPLAVGGAPVAAAGQQLPHLGFPPVPASPAGVAAASHLSAVVTSTPAAALQSQV